MLLLRNAVTNEPRAVSFHRFPRALISTRCLGVRLVVECITTLDRTTFSSVSLYRPTTSSFTWCWNAIVNHKGGRVLGPKRLGDALVWDGGMVVL